MILTEDIAKTILAGCYKFGAATMLRCEGATMTKVIEVYEEDTQTERSDWNKREEAHRNRRHPSISTK